MKEKKKMIIILILEKEGMSDQVLRDYISFILTNADSSELLRITNDIQG